MQKKSIFNNFFLQSQMEAEAKRRLGSSMQMPPPSASMQVCLISLTFSYLKKLTIIILITANASAVPKRIFYSEKDYCTS